MAQESLVGTHGSDGGFATGVVNKPSIQNPD